MGKWRNYSGQFEGYNKSTIEPPKKPRTASSTEGLSREDKQLAKEFEIMAVNSNG